MHRRKVDTAFDNRDAWAVVLDNGFCEGRPGHLAELKAICCFYLAFEASTGDCERALAIIKAGHEAHRSEAKDVVWETAEISMDGPSDEGSMFQKRVVTEGNDKKVHLLVTPFSRRLQGHWLTRHGRRFHVYKRRKDLGQAKGHQKGSEAGLRTKQGLTRTALSQKKGKDKALLGKSNRHFRQDPQKRMDKSSVWNAQMDKQRRLIQLRKMQRRTMAAGRTPMQPISERRGQVFGADAGGASAAAARSVRDRLANSSAVSVLNASKNDVLINSERRNAITTWDPASKMTTWLPQLKAAQIVVLDSVTDLLFSHGRGRLG